MAENAASNNFAQGTLSAAIVAADVTLVLTAGQGARFDAIAGGDWYYLALIDYNETIYDRWEIVKATALNVDTFTIVRNQENSSAAKDFPITGGNPATNVVVVMAHTVQQIKDLVAAVLAAGPTIANPAISAATFTGVNTNSGSFTGGNYDALYFAVGENVEAITADKVLADTDKVNQLLDPGAKVLNVDLPTAVADVGRMFRIKNTCARASIGNTTLDLPTDVFTKTTHGLLDGNRVSFQDSTGVIPLSLHFDHDYFIRDKTADTFKIARASGEAAVDMTVAEGGVLTTHAAGRLIIRVNGATQAFYLTPGAEVVLYAKTNTPTTLADWEVLYHSRQFDSFLGPSGNFTVPQGVDRLEMFLVGGGGSGGGNSGGGGGSGAFVSAVLDVTPGDVIPYTIGAGGPQAGAGAVGITGSATVMGGVSAAGGGGGQNSAGGSGGGAGGDVTPLTVLSVLPFSVRTGAGGGNGGGGGPGTDSPFKGGGGGAASAAGGGGGGGYKVKGAGGGPVSTGLAADDDGGSGGGGAGSGAYSGNKGGRGCIKIRF